ncbi:MAG: glutaminyl-peptide cyclotransferase [Flavobacteriaceae bacterium]|nr:glutaminyl-peptide cyclotransferase [Flavobacteriaceae bacterium]
MRLQKYIVALITGLLVLSSCNDPYKFKLTTSKKLVFNDEATATLTEKNNKLIDSIYFFVNGKRVASEGNSITFSTTNLGVGKYSVSALVFYPEKTKKVNNSIEILSNIAPANYNYKLINTYPHDKNAYTQGLEYHNGFLYETTGQYGKSVLRKVELKTGKVLQEVKLDEKYFGEGMTILNDKIHWLTWQAKKGFTYDLETFKQEGEFSYTWSQQGWGLTNNGTDLIKSDGTHKIYFLDGKTGQEKKSIQVYYNKGKVDLLNELELINGKIYANRWDTAKPIKSGIFIINPENGIIEGSLDLDNLRKIVLKDQTLSDDDVLNGIAYDADNNRIFVTGKKWGKLFEIELVKQ